MEKVTFNLEYKKVLDEILLSRPQVRAGKMFGFPAYFVNKKLFACVYENGVAIKLPAEEVRLLVDGQTFVPFQPFGQRTMREWVLIRREVSADFYADTDLFATSIEFIEKSS